MHRPDCPSRLLVFNTHRCGWVLRITIAANRDQHLNFLARRKPCGSALRSKRSRSHANENHHWKRLTDFAIAVDNRPNAPGGSGKRQSFQLRQTQTFRPPVHLSHSYSPNCNGHKVKKKRQAVCLAECLTLAHFSCIDSGRVADY